MLLIKNLKEEERGKKKPKVAPHLEAKPEG